MSKKRERAKKNAFEADDLEVDAVAQAEANQELLEACRVVSLARAKAALKKGAVPSQDKNTRRTGLAVVCACEDEELWPAAEDIVKLLLTRGFFSSVVDDEGLNALHIACMCSSRAVVKLLLDADAVLVDAVVNTTDLLVYTNVFLSQI